MPSAHLRRKVPPLVLMFSDNRWFWTVFGIGLAVFLLYGPIIGRPPDHNGLRYLLAPWLCPIVPAAYYAVAGFTPYRGYPAKLAGQIDLDKRDEDARQLVATFSSQAAHRVLLRSALLTSATIFAMMLIVTIAVRDSLTWTLQSYWLGQGILGCCVGSLGPVKSAFVSWGLKTWAGTASAASQ